MFGRKINANEKYIFKKMFGKSMQNKSIFSKHRFVRKINGFRFARSDSRTPGKVYPSKVYPSPPANTPFGGIT